MKKTNYVLCNIKIHCNCGLCKPAKCLIFVDLAVISFSNSKI